MSELDFSNLTWETWWMLLSAGMVLVGFVGRQLVHLAVGARTIAAKGDTAPRYSPAEEQLLAARNANRAFKAEVERRALGTRLGRLFFYLLLLGLAAHAGFWVYAATMMQG